MQGLWGDAPQERQKSRLALARIARQHHGSNDRYTPNWLLDRVRTFYGDAGHTTFDPCPASYGRVPPVNGLEVRWTGHVWCNPPYRPIEPWIRKAISEPVDELILLCPALLFAYPILFVYGRLRFTGLSGEIGQAPHASVLVYRGDRVAQFAEAFADVGTFMRRL